jgi:hypothetical protein
VGAYVVLHTCREMMLIGSAAFTIGSLDVPASLSETVLAHPAWVNEQRRALSAMPCHAADMRVETAHDP